MRALVCVSFASGMVCGGHYLMCTVLYESVGYSTCAQMFGKPLANINVLRMVVAHAFGVHLRRCICQVPASETPVLKHAALGFAEHRPWAFLGQA